MRLKNMVGALMALVLAAVACNFGGAGETLPPTLTPGAPTDVPSPTPQAGGVENLEWFSVELDPSDQEGLEARADEIYQELVNSGGEVDRGVLIDAYAELASLEHVGGEWRFAGPAPVEDLHDEPGLPPMPTSGRVNSFVIDPRDSNVVYAAASVGGIWKTKDGGATWASLTDEQVPLNYGGIVMDPQNPDTLYALLGEFDGQIASDYGYLANGIMRSTDAGQTWTLVGADTFVGASVTALVFDADGNLYAASGQTSVFAAPPDQPDFGIFRSSDGGDSWERLVSCEDYLSCTPTNGDITALLGGFMDLDIASDGTLFASLCAIQCYNTILLRSRDGGQSWDELDFSDALQTWQDENNLEVVTWQDRPLLDGLEIAVAPSDPNVVIAGGGLYYQGDEGEAAWSWVIRSTDGGDTWEWLSETGDYCSNGGGGSQCSYDNAVEIDPNDANIMYIGGATQNPDTHGYERLVMRSDDGGDTWTDLTPESEGSRIHPDVHGIAIDPNNPDLLWVGSDGGIYKTEDASSDPPSWNYAGPGVGTLLFVDLGIGPSDAGYIIGGLQDNSCAFTNDGGQVWHSTTCGGDGAYTAVDPFDPSIVYGSTYPYWVFNVNEQGGVGEDYASEPWQTRTDGLNFDGEYWPFRPPFTVDPNNEGVIYIHSSRVYQTTDRGETWEPISDDLTTGNYSYIQSLSIAPTNSDVLYVGTTEGTVFVTTDGGGEWTDVSGSNFPTRPVKRVLVDPRDEATAYVVFTGFDVQTPDTPGHIFRTTDGGESWEDISANLSDAPLSSIVVDERDAYAGVYVGGALGVWVLPDGAEEWQPYGTGMPFTLVTDLELNPETGVLAAGTWGRSVWVIDMP